MFNLKQAFNPGQSFLLITDWLPIKSIPNSSIFSSYCLPLFFLLSPQLSFRWCGFSISLTWLMRKETTASPQYLLLTKAEDSSGLRRVLDSLPTQPPHILFTLFCSCFSSLSALASALLLSICARSTILHTESTLSLKPLWITLKKHHTRLMTQKYNDLEICNKNW